MLEFYKEILSALESAERLVSIGKPGHLTVGICSLIRHNFDGTYGVALNTLQRHYNDWPHYNGNKNFPVPHPTMEPDDAFLTIDNIWDLDTEYGRLRHDLLQHCMARLREDIASMEART